MKTAAGRPMAVLAAAAAAAVALAAPPAAAQAEGRFDLGARVDAVVADGEPANDLLGVGVLGRFRLSDRWWIAVSVDHSPGFDVERPYEFLGLVADESDEVIDAEADMTMLAAALERRYTRPGRRLEWYWGVSAGFANVDVADARGPLAGGGTFDIAQDVGTELVAGAAGGFRLALGRSWGFDFDLRLEQHFTDWQVTDRVSGRTGELDDYLVQGGRFGLSYRF